MKSDRQSLILSNIPRQLAEGHQSATLLNTSKRSSSSQLSGSLSLFTVTHNGSMSIRRTVTLELAPPKRLLHSQLNFVRWPGRLHLLRPEFGDFCKRQSICSDREHRLRSGAHRDHAACRGRSEEHT